MKIETNQKIRQYLDKCMKSLELNQISQLVQMKYDGTILTEEKELEIKKLYSLYGIKYSGCKYMKNILLDNPYYLNIKLSDIETGRFKYENFTLEKGSYVVVDELRSTNEYLGEYTEMRCLSQSMSFPILKEGDEIWMSITPAEINSQKQAVKNARGKCLVFGLGLGYYQYMISMKKSVKSITVIEKDINVINLFKENILPQFGELADKINIVHGDLYDYWNEEYLSLFDYIYVDVWKGPVDGFEIVEKMYQQYNPQNKKVDLWIEYTIYKFLRVAMLLYFRVLSGDISVKLKMAKIEFLKECYNRVESYFSSLDKVIASEKELKNYLNSTQIYRDILAYK